MTVKPAKKETKPATSSAWNLATLDELSTDVSNSNSTAVGAAVSSLDFRQHGETLEKKATRMRSRWVPLLCLMCVAGLVLWASMAKIDQVTRGHGKVIPSSKVQTVQSLEDGIVIDIPVGEGDIVEEGQAVLLLDDTYASANYAETVDRRDLILARMSRLQAEANNFIEPEYPESLGLDIVTAETELFNARREDYLARKQSLEQQLRHARSELEILRLGQDSMTKLDLIHAQRDVSTLPGNLKTLTSDTRRSALDTHDTLRAELASLNSALLRSEDTLQRKVLRSPTHGTVNKIHVTGAGGVIRGGDGVMEIVPINDTLLVEANIRPEDIGFIHSDQAATVKFTAYDFTIYGGMEGVVEYIGVDTIRNDMGETYYPVRIRTDSNIMGSKDGRELSIIPGMVAEIDILAGQKSVLQYLLTPLNRAREKALTEQ